MSKQHSADSPREGRIDVPILFSFFDSVNGPVQAMKRLALGAVLILATALSGPADAEKSFTHKEVRARIELMQSNRDALETLHQMMAGQRRFSASEASAARRSLLRNLRKIPRAFRKERMEPLSNARPGIWLNGDDFDARAKAAAKAAAAVKSQNLPALRRTLPDLFHACLSCHDAYRNRPREFTTH